MRMNPFPNHSLSFYLNLQVTDLGFSYSCSEEEGECHEGMDHDFWMKAHSLFLFLLLETFLVPQFHSLINKEVYSFDSVLLGGLTTAASAVKLLGVSDL